MGVGPTVIRIASESRRVRGTRELPRDFPPARRAVRPSLGSYATRPLALSFRVTARARAAR